MTFRYLLCLLFILGLSGCAELMLGKATANYVMEDRPLGSSAMDTKTEFTLRSDLFDYDHTFPVKTSLMVSERRVLVVGNMDNQIEIETVEEILWQNPYITKVYNYMKVKDGSVIDSGQDVVLEKMVVMHLLGAEGVTSSNYKIIVKDKVAYILGYAKNKKEKELMIKALEQVSGLYKIVPFVIIDG